MGLLDSIKTDISKSGGSKGAFFFVRDGEKKEKVLQVVKNLSPGLEEKVEALFGERKDVLSKIYPDLGGKACSEITEDGCCYREITDLYKRLFRAEKEHPADPENLRRVFQRG